MTPEPTAGLPRVDCFGVTWTPSNGAWWGVLILPGVVDDQPCEVWRTWHELDKRHGPLTVKTNEN